MARTLHRSSATNRQPVVASTAKSACCLFELRQPGVQLQVGAFGWWQPALVTPSTRYSLTR
jgi:hypothetical protein